MTPSPRFTFVRHGQCVANAQGRVAGQLDSPLTTLGHSQAEATAVLLSSRKDLTAVVTSDLQRARATAQIIAGVLNLPLFNEPGLREQCFGSMEGQLFEDLTASSPGAEHINEVRWGNGESVADVHARLIETFDRITRTHPGPIVLVTHGHVIQIGMALLQGRGARDIEWFDLPNGGIVNCPATGSLLSHDGHGTR
ncbi:MAG: histidine phosphatase family protein [Propioniciclava sp.]|uniref:histidine phosphatase family protein n=1 Tax=Propioniciclava sp. TaxID=2038686 RepID=UPI0039E4F1C1